MKILALRRNPEESRSDPDVDQVSDLSRDVCGCYLMLMLSISLLLPCRCTALMT
jgi:hypothetical protein